jgi:hypothetical protein
MSLIEDWRRVALRLWSIRLALLWAAVAGLYAALPAFMDVLPPGVFAVLSVLASMLIVGARLTKQPGLDEL